MTKKSLIRGMLARGLTFVAGAALVFSGCSSMQAYKEETATSIAIFDAASGVIALAGAGGMLADDLIWTLQHLNAANPLTVDDAANEAKYSFLKVDTARTATEEKVFPDLAVETNGYDNGWVNLRYQNKTFVMEFERRNGAQGNETYKPFVTAITSCLEKEIRPAAGTGAEGGSQ